MSHLILKLAEIKKKYFDEKPDDMKAICHHLRLRKNAVSQAAKNGGQIHADDFDRSAPGILLIRSRIVSRLLPSKNS